MNSETSVTGTNLLAASSAAALRQELARQMARTIQEFDLINAGDRILVAVSGGKDSATLLDLLLRARARAPVSFELVAFHLDQRQPGYNGRPLEEWLAGLGVEYRIHSEDTYSAVLEQTRRTGDSYCGPCSRLRRGILYTWAAQLGCNKVALGHHRDDALETLLMNLCYGGKLQAMPAVYRTQDGRFEVLRPLIECKEAVIAEYARHSSFPILPCRLCGSQLELSRERMAALLRELERSHPQVRNVMFSALKNVRPTHLLDREVAAAWRVEAHRFAERR